MVVLDNARARGRMKALVKAVAGVSPDNTCSPSVFAVAVDGFGASGLGTFCSQIVLPSLVSW